MGELTQVTAGRQLEESSAGSSLSVRPLKKAEITQFDSMMAGMIAYYPHQELPESTLKQYRAELRLMATQHGIDLLREALLSARRQPGRKFFPHPSEVSEILEEMATKAKAEAVKKLPNLGCELCHEKGWADGWILELDPAGDRRVKKCACYLVREQAKKAQGVLSA